MRPSKAACRYYILVAVMLGELLTALPAAAEGAVTIGTAGVTGVYYPAGGAICRLVNRSRKDHGVRCGVESTDGSINNLELIRERRLEIGVVQSDLLYHAYRGEEPFTTVGADKDLRALFALHAEPFTVIVRKDSKINSFDDLKGKRIDMGAQGSGMRATMEELIRSKGWTQKAFTAVVDLKSGDQAKALCSGRVDAMIYAGGHPNGAIQQVTTACGTKILSVDGPAIDLMVRENPFFTNTVIPAGMYSGNERDVRTFGMTAILTVSSELSDDAAYQITKSVFDNLDNFKTLHPVFAGLDAQAMVADADVVPYHPGALRYFREKGFLTDAVAH